MGKAEENKKLLHSRYTWKQVPGHQHIAKAGFCLRHQASPENRPLASLQSLYLNFSLAFTPPAFQRFWRLQISGMKPLPIQNTYGGFCESWLTHWSIPCFSNWSTRTKPWQHRVLIKAEKHGTYAWIAQSGHAMCNEFSFHTHLISPTRM